MAINSEIGCLVSRGVLSRAIDLAFALCEQTDVIWEAAFTASNEGTEDPEAVLERIKHLAMLANVAARELTVDLGERMPIDSRHKSNPAAEGRAMNEPNTIRRRLGHCAAEAWYADFHKRGEVAEGYEFPSQLREAFAALPPAEQSHFLDGIGAYMVLWLTTGEPTPGSIINIAEEIRNQALTPAEQDARFAEDDHE